MQSTINISIHALLAESDAAFCQAVPPKLYFYPRSPCGERLSCFTIIYVKKRDFYPRSPCGERRYLINTYHRIFGISIHALLAESDKIIFLLSCLFKNFYPRSPCGERRSAKVGAAGGSVISIHALLAESDLTIMLYNTSSLIFLSTLSLRRATSLPLVTT